MRHQRAGKKLGRDSAHRKALYANLTCALIEHGRIKTTVTKAKAVKPIAEQMITLGRRGDLHARRQAVAFLRSKDVVHKLFAEVGPAFADRPGGYARIVKLGPRPGDAAEMAYLELVEGPVVFKTRLPVDGTEEPAEAVAAARDDVEDEAGSGEPDVVQPDSGDTGVEEDVAADPDEAAADESSGLDRVAAEEPPSEEAAAEALAEAEAQGEDEAAPGDEPEQKQ